MADTRGCWSLSEAWAEKSAAEWVPLPEVWVTPAAAKVNTGYIGGGYPAANVDKLNFANDTKTNLGNILPGSPRKSGAVGGNTHGYFGGKHPGYENFINKIVYATDAGSRIPATLSAGRGYLAGCNSATNGYFVGGAGSFNSYRSIVDRITHATDTCARIPSANLPSANTKQSNMATTASPSAAYCGGGVSPATTAVSKLTFATEASAQVPGAAMITARGYASCSSNGTNTYWYAGSSNNNGTAPTSDIDKTVFASDTTTNIPANMVLNGYNTRKAATGNTTFGVIAGGNLAGGPANLGSAFKFTYSNETQATAPGMNLSSDKKEASGSSARNGFTGTTYDGTRERWFDGDTGATDTVLFDGDNDHLSITGWGSNSRFSAYAMTWECWVKFTGSNGTLETIWENRSSTSSNDGFLIGRFHTSGHENKIEMYTANDYRITTDVTVADNVWTHVAYSRDGNNAEARIYINGTEAGSFTDGYNYDHTGTAYIGRNASGSHRMQGYITNMRFVKGQSLYTSNFTVPTEPLTSTSQGATASSGDAGTKFIICNSSDIEEGTVLEDSLSISESGFSSNDSVSQTGVFAGPPAATPTASTSLSGPQGIKNEGYLIQGIQGATSGSGRSDVYRLDYSTETWNSSVFANSTLTRKRGGATSTTTNAYIGGGTLAAADGNPTGGDMDKLTYATSTMSRIPGSDAGRIPSSKGIDGQPAAGNQTLGYWGGGYGNPGAGRSHIDKFVYSSETASSLPNYPWPQNNLGVAVAMQTHAYLGGGPSDTGTNFVKITFANDTYSSKNGWTTYNSEKKYSGATSSPSKAYIVGGNSLERQMDVTTWANDTTVSSPSTKLASPGFSYAPGQGGNEAGYFTGGGNTGNNGTTTEKITFATDTSAILPGAYFPGGTINSYSTGGPNMNGVGTNSPNTI